jgi:ketosteroid isomerase-like protein
MTDQSALQGFLEAAEGIGRGDFEPFVARFSDQATWVVPGHSPMAGTYRGKEGIRKFFADAAERTGDGFHPQPVEALADENYAALFLRVTGHRPGADLDVKIAHFATVDADGQFVRNWFLPDDLDAFDAFLA